jgi:hypothetical protein
MPNPNDLNLVAEEEAPDIESDEMPRQYSPGFTKPPQPLKTYQFRLPADISSVYDTFDTERGQRIKAQFRSDKALANVTTGESLDYTVTTQEREYGKAGEKKLGSEMAFLLTALGEKTIPAFSNSRKLMAALSSHGGGLFKADVDWEATCQKDRDIYTFDATQGKSVKAEGKKGCGRKWATRSYTAPKATDGKSHLIPKDNGLWVDNFECVCGAMIRVFVRLVNYREA